MALFDAALGMTAVAQAVDDRAIVDALFTVEIALARACARAGLIDLPTALEVGAACAELSGFDPDELGRRAADDGDPVSPLVTELRARVAARAGSAALAAVQLGATNEDVLDTALMIISHRALGVIGANLTDCASAAAALARDHRDTPMAVRSVREPAVPTSFGALAAVWGASLDRSAFRLAELRDRLPVQLGGAGGTLAALYPHGFTVQAAFAAELDLADPSQVRHSDRTPITELAGALGDAAAAVESVAGDVVLLASPAVGELAEAAPGSSSATNHDSVAAITAREAAAQAPGLVATLLLCAAQPHPGPRHAYWPALIGLLRAVGGAASRLRTSLTALHVDTAAMAADFDRLCGAVETAEFGHAGDLVDRYLAERDDDA